MIILPLIDLFISAYFNHSSYLFLVFVSRLNRNNVLSYLFLIAICDYFYNNWFFINTLLVIFLYIVNKKLLYKYKENKVIIIDYLFYFLILEIIFNSVDLLVFLTIFSVSIIESFLINHILPKMHIYLFR